jgi:hypothetical protein
MSFSFPIILQIFTYMKNYLLMLFSGFCLIMAAGYVSSCDIAVVGEDQLIVYAHDGYDPTIPFVDIDFKLLTPAATIDYIAELSGTVWLRSVTIHRVSRLTAGGRDPPVPAPTQSDNSTSSYSSNDPFT